MSAGRRARSIPKAVVGTDRFTAPNQAIAMALGSDVQVRSKWVALDALGMVEDVTRRMATSRT